MKKLLLAAFLLTSPAWAQQPPDLGRRLPVDPIPPVMKQIPAEIPMAGVEAGGNPGPLNDLIHSQTAAVNFLNRKIEDLEKRVAALEKRK